MHDRIYGPEHAALRSISNVDRHHDLATAVGRVIGNFSCLETSLMLVFGQLMRCDQSRGNIVFQSINSMDAKIRLTKMLVRGFVEDRELKAKCYELLAQTSKVNSSRNKLVHGTVGGRPEDGGFKLISSRPPNADSKELFKPSQSIDVDAINALADDISIIDTRLSHLWVSHEIVQKVSARPLW